MNGRPAFALAGQVVTTPAQAQRIQRAAEATDHAWLIPQCESVARQLAQSATKAAPRRFTGEPPTGFGGL